MLTIPLSAGSSVSLLTASKGFATLGFPLPPERGLLLRALPTQTHSLVSFEIWRHNLGSWPSANAEWQDPPAKHTQWVFKLTLNGHREAQPWYHLPP